EVRREFDLDLPRAVQLVKIRSQKVPAGAEGPVGVGERQVEPLVLDALAHQDQVKRARRFVVLKAGEDEGDRAAGPLEKQPALVGIGSERGHLVAALCHLAGVASDAASDVENGTDALGNEAEEVLGVPLLGRLEILKLQGIARSE